MYLCVWMLIINKLLIIIKKARDVIKLLENKNLSFISEGKYYFLMDI